MKKWKRCKHCHKLCKKTEMQGSNSKKWACPSCLDQQTRGKGSVRRGTRASTHYDGG